MDYTLEMCKADMLAFWGWAIENPTKEKVDFIDQLPINEKLRWLDMGSSFCPACIYAKQLPQPYDGRYCALCPIQNWGAKPGTNCCADTSPYYWWITIGDDSTMRSAYAEAIYRLSQQIEVRDALDEIVNTLDCIPAVLCDGPCRWHGETGACNRDPIFNGPDGKAGCAAVCSGYEEY